MTYRLSRSKVLRSWFPKFASALGLSKRSSTNHNMSTRKLKEEAHNNTLVGQCFTPRLALESTIYVLMTVYPWDIILAMYLTVEMLHGANKARSRAVPLPLRENPFYAIVRNNRLDRKFFKLIPTWYKYVLIHNKISDVTVEGLQSSAVDIPCQTSSGTF